MKSKFAAITAVLTGIPNAGLTMIFFFVLIGNLSNFISVDIANILRWILAIFIGVGFVTGEGLVHMDSKDKGFNLTLFVILVAMGLINVGAGHFRADEAARIMRSDARILVKEDPRFIELSREKEHLQKNVLDDGSAANDAMAMERMREIDTELQRLSQEYVGDAHVSHVQHSGLISIFFVALNLVFGVSVRTWYNEQDEVRPFRMPSFWFIRPKGQTESGGYTYTPATSKTGRGNSAEFQIGFHPPASTASSPIVNSSDEDNKSTVIVERVEVPVEKVVKETEIIDHTRKLTGGMNEDRMRQLLSRVAIVKRTILDHPDLSTRAQARKADMPEGTFRGLKKRIRNGEFA